MSLPCFYIAEIDQGITEFVLNEDASRHIVQVLRMTTGEQLQLTNGKGKLFTAEIVNDHKKKAEVKISSTSFVKAPERKISIAISLLKNASRFEWFLEKATEIGVNEIIPLICTRTEKQHFRFERMNGILISALQQSQQAWLPVLHKPVQFGDLKTNPFENYDRLIAHCLPVTGKKPLHSETLKFPNRLILIGPEGDFTQQEIDAAMKNDFIPVSLGKTRLRTETAGIVAATLLCMG